MWLRKIGKANTAASVVLPAQMVRELGWKIGDYLQVDVLERDCITMRRIDPAKLPDRIIQAAMPDSVIAHE
jgi:antitoxin component of MazEF toxin-antitoxin module